MYNHGIISLAYLKHGILYQQIVEQDLLVQSLQKMLHATEVQLLCPTPFSKVVLHLCVGYELGYSAPSQPLYQDYSL